MSHVGTLRFGRSKVEGLSSLPRTDEIGGTSSGRYLSSRYSFHHCDGNFHRYDGKVDNQEWLLGQNNLDEGSAPIVDVDWKQLDSVATSRTVGTSQFLCHFWNRQICLRPHNLPCSPCAIEEGLGSYGAATFFSTLKRLS